MLVRVRETWGRFGRTDGVLGSWPGHLGGFLVSRMREKRKERGTTNLVRDRPNGCKSRWIRHASSVGPHWFIL